jgi:hypothetical protein
VSFLSLTVLTAVCLLLRPLQGYAVIALALLLYLYPVPTLALVLATAGAYALWRYRQ